ncbi:hypothetical protein [Candidatus Brachybacter algidus]|uniref:hypothetical protein n=1 Tax=Candidatus Brachybacter algidus TaxID=2982024 RepID=UPI001DC077A9|nr:hypothetical protein [Candidatus Brachybacter algidus]MBK6450136.1 hypothetical protein [Candidatus Brachybacter algidus]
MLAHLQFAQTNTQTKNCKRASKSAAEKNFKFFSPTLKKKLKHPTRKPTTMQTADKINFTADRHYTAQTEGQQLTAVWQKWRFSASYDSFVVQQTVVLRINICGEIATPAAAKRCASY